MLKVFRIQFFCSLILILGYTPVFSQANDSLIKDKTKKEYLEMRGVVKISKTSEKGIYQLLDSALVRIYSDTLKPCLLALFTDKKGKCDFRLPLNRKYFIVISKPGYVPKKLEVTTAVPVEKRSAFIFPFSVDIFVIVEGLDVSPLRKPIAKIFYATNDDHFIYDYTYTNKVNADLKKLYKEYYSLVVQEMDTVSTVVPPPQDNKKKSKTPKK
jgi:hypothetical protein